MWDIFKHKTELGWVGCVGRRGDGGEEGKNMLDIGICQVLYFHSIYKMIIIVPTLMFDVRFKLYIYVYLCIYIWFVWVI